MNQRGGGSKPPPRFFMIKHSKGVKSMAEEYILEMNHITKEFSGVKALNDVNIKVRKGEIHALCGENGAGKSTLMNVLSGVWPYGTYTGDVVYKGEVCQFHNLKDSEAKGIVIIHQELALSPYLSIAENVFLGNVICNRYFSCFPDDFRNFVPDKFVVRDGMHERDLIS